MNLKNTYFGFTNNLKPLQRGKQEKSLDIMKRFDSGIMTEKEHIFYRLQEGYKPDIEENYSYYSPRIDGYTKPKTLYKLEKESSFYELNKTLYNYAIYLLENDFINTEKANTYITNELKEKEEMEHLEQEQIKKEQEEKERKQETERKQAEEIRQKKIEVWRTKGNELMTPDVRNLVTDIVNKNIDKYEVEINHDQRKEYINNIINKLPELLGNQGFLSHTLQYHVEEGYKRDYFHPMTIEAEILMSVFNINNDDSSRTITAKIKAVHENREYKGKTA